MVAVLWGWRVVGKSHLGHRGALREQKREVSEIVFVVLAHVALELVPHGPEQGEDQATVHDLVHFRFFRHTSELNHPGDEEEVVEELEPGLGVVSGELVAKRSGGERERWHEWGAGGVVGSSCSVWRSGAHLLPEALLLELDLLEIIQGYLGHPGAGFGAGVGPAPCSCWAA